ncbi:MAG: hypothetical protein PUG60_10370 [Lachnospiraceae bacterium]|nr:hypothetical protein [Lachnospiraceae bacterium]
MNKCVDQSDLECQVIDGSTLELLQPELHLLFGQERFFYFCPCDLNFESLFLVFKLHHSITGSFRNNSHFNSAQQVTQ